MYSCAVSVPRSPRENEARAKSVYVIARFDSRWFPDDVCKIGISSNVRKRLTGIQASNPDHLKIFFTVKPTDRSALSVEQEALGLLSPWKSKGEWLQCEPGLAVAVINGIVAGYPKLREFVTTVQRCDDFEKNWRDEALFNAAHYDQLDDLKNEHPLMMAHLTHHKIVRLS